MSAIIWIALFLGLIIALVIFTRSKRSPASPSISQFALANNLTYIPELDGLLDPEIFASLSDPEFETLVTVRDCLVEPSGRGIYFSSVVFPKGDTEETEHDSTLEYLGSSEPARIEATFMLLPKGRDKYFNTEGLTPLSFEGEDLNDIYKLFVKPGDEINTLQLLGPDDMIWLVKANPNAAVIQQNTLLNVLMPDVTSVASAPGTLTSFDYQFKLITSICERLAWEVRDEPPPA